mmetsp:Transcript_29347/g.93949  ORF Transcript_29347/g.93949 Transcript_29347/m.93949 type:complete len:145 (-) Transcript_29347:1294-1728(-)
MSAAAEDSNTRPGWPKYKYLTKEDLENTPTRKQAGWPSEKEKYYRKTYCAFITELGQKLKMTQLSIATAVMFCHRYFVRQSLAVASNDRFVCPRKPRETLPAFASMAIAEKLDARSGPRARACAARGGVARARGVGTRERASPL